MPSPSGCSDLTGATRYRKGWFGVWVLQIEEKYREGIGGRPRCGEDGYAASTRWRDATENDLRMIEWFERTATAKLHNLPPPAPPERYAMLGG